MKDVPIIITPNNSNAIDNYCLTYENINLTVLQILYLASGSTDRSILVAILEHTPCKKINSTFRTNPGINIL